MQKKISINFRYVSVFFVAAVMIASAIFAFGILYQDNFAKATASDEINGSITDIKPANMEHGAYVSGAVNITWTATNVDADEGIEVKYNVTFSRHENSGWAPGTGNLSANGGNSTYYIWNTTSKPVSDGEWWVNVTATMWDQDGNALQWINGTARKVVVRNTLPGTPGVDLWQGGRYWLYNDTNIMANNYQEVISSPATSSLYAGAEDVDITLNNSLSWDSDETYYLWKPVYNGSKGTPSLYNLDWERYGTFPGEYVLGGGVMMFNDIDLDRAGLWLISEASVNTDWGSGTNYSTIENYNSSGFAWFWVNTSTNYTLTLDDYAWCYNHSGDLSFTVKDASDTETECMVDVRSDVSHNSTFGESKYAATGTYTATNGKNNSNFWQIGEYTAYAYHDSDYYTVSNGKQYYQEKNMDGNTNDQHYNATYGSNANNNGSASWITSYAYKYNWITCGPWDPPENNATVKPIKVSPNATIDLYNQTLDSTRVNISFQRNSSADKTILVYSNSNYPTDPSNGTELYNGTGNYFIHTGLSPGQTYYYLAAPWNTTYNMVCQNFNNTGAQTYSGGQGGFIDSWSSSVNRSYIMNGTSHNFSFNFFPCGISNIHNLTIALPNDFSFVAEENGTSVSDKSSFDVTNTATSITWNATEYPTGFEIDQTTTFGFKTSTTASIGQHNFTIIAYNTMSEYQILTIPVFVTTDFSFSGQIKNRTGVVLQGAQANITVQTMGGESAAPATFGHFTALTNSTGNFTVTGIPTIDDLSDLSNVQMGPGGGGSVMYTLSCGEYNDSTYNYAMNISSSLPNMPTTMFVASLNNSEIYLRPAVTFIVNASGPDYNWSTGNIDSYTDKSFQLMVKDKKLGFSVKELDASGGTTKRFSVPCGTGYQRNYTMTIYPQQGFPMSLNFSNIINTCRNNAGDFSIPGVTTSAQEYDGTYAITVNINTTTTDRNFSGFFTGISDSLQSMKIIAYTMEDANMVFENWALPFNLGNMDSQGFNDVYDLSNKHFNITLPGTQAPSYLMLRAYATTEDGYYMGSKIITSSSGQLSTSNSSFVMRPLVQGVSRNVTQMNCSNNWTEETVASTKAVQFNLVDTNGNLLSSENSFVEILRDHNDSKDYKFMLDATNGTFSVSMNNNTDFKELTIYSQSYAPVSTPVSWDIISGNTTTQIFNCTSGICSVTLRSFGSFDPLGEGASFDMGMYTSNETCNVPNPPSHCDLCGGAMDGDSFSPLKAILKGDINMMITSGNVSVYYINTDLLASGPPDAVFTTNGTEVEGGLEEAYKFGSQGPDIYDYILLKVPCPENIQNKTINVSMPILYNNEFSPLWNRSAGDNLSDITGNATLYNMYHSYIGSQYEPYINGTGVIANETDSELSSNVVYYDRTNQSIWLKIPHFSASETRFGGTPPTAPTSLTATAASSSSISLSWTKASNADYTMVRRGTSTYPTTVTSGTNVSNSTGSSATDTGLSAGTKYYYSAWSWNDTEELWSTSYDTSYATTSSAGGDGDGDGDTGGTTYYPATGGTTTTTTTTTTASTSKDDVESLFSVTLSQNFTASDTDGDGNLGLDEFNDPNNVLDAQRTVTVNGNSTYLVSVDGSSDNIFLWDTSGDTVTQVVHSTGTVASPVVDEENEVVKITVTVDKTEWIYIEVPDEYPDISNLVVETNGRIISSDMIWRENGKIYVLDDANTQYDFSYAYDILTPSFSPTKDTTFETATPTITITYSENVTITSATLNDEAITLSSTFGKVFTYTPTTNLSDGDYVLSISVNDSEANTRNDTATYTIDAVKDSTTETPDEKDNSLMTFAIIVIIVIILILLIVGVLFKTGYLYIEKEDSKDKGKKPPKKKK